jgi:hypothetical protein
MPGVVTFTQFGSFGGIPHGTHWPDALHMVSFSQSLSVLQVVIDTQTPCEQIWVFASHGTVHATVPPPAPPAPELELVTRPTPVLLAVVLAPPPLPAPPVLVLPWPVPFEPPHP